MESFDRFDNFDLFSYLERQYKLKGLKLNALHRFFEAKITKYYDVYKKNKNSKITFNEYKIQFLKEYIRNKKGKEKGHNYSFCSLKL